MITSLDETGELTGKQAAALAGLAPFAQDSGPRHTRGGCPGLRSPPYMAALTASRCNPDLTRFCQRLCGNGKPPKLALIAAARKLIVPANALVTQNRTWVPIGA